jgi:PAS domain S-box-containing protein
MHRDNEVFWRADHTYFPVEYWSYPQVVEGSVIGTVVTFIDITERKQSEQLLASERRRLSNILEGTNVGTWEWNVQTGVTVFNERWANIMGYTLSDLSPVSIDTWRQLCHPEDVSISDELLAKHFAREMDYYDCEIRMRHKNGGWVWVLDRGKIASWTDDGKPLLMSGTHQDITERKVIEDYLRLSEAQNRALLDAIPDLILRIHRDGTILDYKASSSEQILFSPDQIVGSLVDQVLDTNKSEQAMKCIEDALLTGQVQKLDFTHVIHDAQVTFEARFKNSSLDEVIAIVRDISEQARLEQMKSDFINRATHELRTPIATMLLMSNLIEGEEGFNLENEYWNVLKSELNRERMLVEDLLTAGRLESDRTHFHFRTVDVLDVLQRVIQSLELAARGNQVEISLLAGTGVDDNFYPVNGDDNALTQVFVNLVGNAIKFSPNGGKVKVELSKNGSGFEISVNDGGIGIPPEDLPMLFSRFFRGTNAIENEIPGTGIGLFIVRSILDKHDGKVRAVSELGKGSTFIVWLPEGV